MTFSRIVLRALWWLERKICTVDEMTPIAMMTETEIVDELKRRNAAVIVRTAREKSRLVQFTRFATSTYMHGDSRLLRYMIHDAAIELEKKACK